MGGNPIGEKNRDLNRISLTLSNREFLTSVAVPIINPVSHTIYCFQRILHVIYKVHFADAASPGHTSFPTRPSLHPLLHNFPIMGFQSSRKTEFRGFWLPVSKIRHVCCNYKLVDRVTHAHKPVPRPSCFPPKLLTITITDIRSEFSQCVSFISRCP